MKQVAFHLQVGRGGGGADEGKEAAVEARKVDAHQEREDGREAEVLQEHPPAAVDTKKVPEPIHLRRVKAASEIVFCEKKVRSNKKTKK